MKRVYWNVFLALSLLAVNKVQAVSPKVRKTVSTPMPDYSLSTNWSALPFRKDAADIIPKSETIVPDSLKTVDVFYIYPTIYTKKSAEYWNADLQDEKLNKRIDNYPVKYQASVFNKDCRVYVPRYRQAHVDVYISSRSGKNREPTFDLAYGDIKAAFEYYLRHYNQGRPIIIAGHSQGSTHAIRLIKEYFDDSIRKKQLVAAYVVGMKVDSNYYNSLAPCNNPTENNCYVTWASYNYKVVTDGSSVDTILVGNVCVNPVTWETKNDTVRTKGSILFNVNRSYSSKVYIKERHLAVKTNTPLAQLWKNMHLFDYNLFWFDIRKNVADRVKHYWTK